MSENNFNFKCKSVTKRDGRKDVYNDDKIYSAIRKAMAAAETLAGKSEKERSTLRAKAKKREEEAVSFVVERIVNG